MINAILLDILKMKIASGEVVLGDIKNEEYKTAILNEIQSEG